MKIETNHINGDNKQLRQVIFKATPKAIKQTKTLAKKFKGKTELDTCRNIFNFLKNKISLFQHWISEDNERSSQKRMLQIRNQ